MTSAAQKAAQKKHDAKRPKPVTVRLTEAELVRLDALRTTGEARAAAMKRLSGITARAKTGAEPW